MLVCTSCRLVDLLDIVERRLMTIEHTLQYTVESTILQKRTSHAESFFFSALLSMKKLVRGSKPAAILFPDKSSSFRPARSCNSRGMLPAPKQMLNMLSLARTPSENYLAPIFEPPLQGTRHRSFLCLPPPPSRSKCCLSRYAHLDKYTTTIACKLLLLF